MRSIQAAVVRRKGGPFLVEPITLDDPRENEVLIRIAGVGLCHTDLVVRDQYFPTPLPAVLGHEGAGIVEAVGARVTKVAEGDAVVLSFASCGVCANCQSGRYGYCPDLYGRNFSGGRPDGSSPCCDAHGARVSGYFFAQSSFGEYAIATERNVVKIPADVPLEIMGPLGCGVQTGAGAVMNVLRPAAGSSIAIFGAGSAFRRSWRRRSSAAPRLSRSISTRNASIWRGSLARPTWSILGAIRLRQLLPILPAVRAFNTHSSAQVCLQLYVRRLIACA